MLIQVIKMLNNNLKKYLRHMKSYRTQKRRLRTTNMAMMPLTEIQVRDSPVIFQRGLEVFLIYLKTCFEMFLQEEEAEEEKKVRILSMKCQSI